MIVSKHKLDELKKEALDLNEKVILLRQDRDNLFELAGQLYSLLQEVCLMIGEFENWDEYDRIMENAVKCLKLEDKD